MRVRVPRTADVDFVNALRKDGYWIIKEGKEIQAVKPFGKGRYPRFHLKVSRENEEGPSFLELHIDWERPRHSQYWGRCATEDNETIRLEVERLRDLLLYL